jgi:hypothetical protein
MVTQRGDRAQLILIAAIVVAVAILGATVLLNAVHSSPDVSAQTDAQSVSDADRTVRQVKYDLRRLFLTIGVDELAVPGADKTTLQEGTAAYSKQFTGLASTNKSAIVNVSYVETPDDDGIVAYSNESNDAFFNESEDAFADDVNGLIIRETESVPRVSLKLEEIGPGESLDVRINDSITSDPEFEFTVEESDVTGDIECDNTDQPVRIDLVYGEGEVASDDSFCSVSLDESKWTGLGAINVTFAGDLKSIEGSYAISATGATTNCADPCLSDSDVVVDPTFEITYQDPNAVYSSEFRLYRRGER